MAEPHSFISVKTTALVDGAREESDNDDDDDDAQSFGMKTPTTRKMTVTIVSRLWQQAICSV
jgi:hypothetical protein